MSGLHAGQRAIIESAGRFNTVVCGRRFGKTTLGLALAFYGAPHCPGGLGKGFDVGWFAPTYKLLDEAWRAAKNVMRHSIVRADATLRRIETVTHGALDFWTLETLDVGRGRRYGLVIVDEAALARHLEPAWNEAIRPTLTDYKGGAWFLSTPKGRNYFWQLAQRGDNPGRWPGWKSHHAQTADNPNIDADEIEAARMSLPERIFRQEYLAEFIDDGGGVFRGVMDAIWYEQPEKPTSNLVIGVDWGRYNDFTVFTVMDALRGIVIELDRFTGIDYAIQLARLKALYARYPGSGIVAEENSIGGPLVESLQREGLPVRAFQTTATSKRAIIESLALAFEQRKIGIPNCPWLINELLAYEQERLPGGMLRYGAPAGGHDDGVMSLAIAWHAAGNAGPYEYHALQSRAHMGRGAKSGVW